MTIRPQPWHPEAQRLSAEGLTYAEIAEAVDRSQQQVSKLLNPAYRERQAKVWARSYRARYANDPIFREKELARRRRYRAAEKETRHAP